MSLKLYTLGTLLFVLLWLASFVKYVSLEVKLQLLIHLFFVQLFHKIGNNTFYF